MKKKLVVLILLLSFAFMPLTAFAASNKITYSETEKKFSQLKIAIGNGINGDMYNSDSDWTKRRLIYYSNQKGSPQDGWTFHKMKLNNDHVYGYCAGVGQFVPTQSSISNEGVDLSTLINTMGVTISPKQYELLKEILSIGPQFYVGKTSGDWEYDIIATQILVWEVVEGGRDDVTGIAGDKYAPNKFNVNSTEYANSAYKLIVTNKSNDTNTYNNYKVLKSYKKTIDDIIDARTKAQSSAAGSNNTLKWDYTKGKYVKTVSGLGKYADNCTANKKPQDSNLKITPNSNGSVTITSDAWFSDNLTITCSYKVPADVVNSNFYYYDFPDNYCPEKPCQKFLYGKQSKVYSINFNLKAEKQNIKIVKVDPDGNALSGSKFKLSNIHGSYTVNLNGNGSAVEFKKSSEYILSETTTPNGYEAMDDLRISFDVREGKVLSCDNSKKDSSGKIISCLNGDVGVDFQDHTFILTIKDYGKSFDIRKLNEKGKNVSGAKFKITKLGSDTAIKFKKDSSSNTYTYDTNGTVTELTGGTMKMVAMIDGEYVITETAAPKGYLLPSTLDERTVRFKISNGSLYKYNKTKKTYDRDPSTYFDIYNYTSTLTIHKTGKGKSLEGVVFALYKSDKTTLLKCTSSNGVYSGCSEQNSAQDNLLVTNSAGKIVIEGLVEGVYYLKEVQTIDPFIIPEGEAAYTKLEIKIENGKVNIYQDDSLTNNHEVPIDNSPNTFTFYKKNENGEFLTGGSFKLMYMDKNGKYHNARIKAITNDGSYDEKADVFEPSDDSNDPYLFTLTNGIATFVNLSPSTSYKIVEVTPPDGYPTKDELKVDEISIEFKIDKYGRAIGASTLINEKLVIIEGDSSAELIINIQTGMDRVRYLLIIVGVIVLIGAAVLIIRKLDKKK